MGTSMRAIRTFNKEEAFSFSEAEFLFRQMHFQYYIFIDILLKDDIRRKRRPLLAVVRGPEGGEKGKKRVRGPRERGGFRKCFRHFRCLRLRSLRRFRVEGVEAGKAGRVERGSKLEIASTTKLSVS